MLRPLLAVLLGSTFVIGAVASPGAMSPAVAAVDADVPAPPGILINELSNGDADSDSDSFFELRNWGTEPVDLTGWHVFRCSAQGLRSNWGRRESDLTGIVLAPGGIVTISRAGMPGDGHITQPFATDGFGLYLAWIAVILLTFHWARVVWSRTAVQLAAEAQRRESTAEQQKRGLLDGPDEPTS